MLIENDDTAPPSVVVLSVASEAVVAVSSAASDVATSALAALVAPAAELLNVESLDEQDAAANSKGIAIASRVT